MLRFLWYICHTDHYPDLPQSNSSSKLHPPPSEQLAALPSIMSASLPEHTSQDVQDHQMPDILDDSAIFFPSDDELLSKGPDTAQQQISSSSQEDADGAALKPFPSMRLPYEVRLQVYEEYGLGIWTVQGPRHLRLRQPTDAIPRGSQTRTSSKCGTSCTSARRSQQKSGTTASGTQRSNINCPPQGTKTSSWILAIGISPTLKQRCGTPSVGCRAWCSTWLNLICSRSSRALRLVLTESSMWTPA